MSPSLAPLTGLYLLDLAIWIVLVIGGTLRLSRLITTDTLGGWLLRDRIGRWSARKERARRMAMREVISRIDPDGPDMTDEGRLLLGRWEEELASADEWISWQGRLVSGLWCPFCVGFWIGVGIIAATILLAPLAVWGAIWAVLLAMLTLNYIVGHVSAKID